MQSSYYTSIDTHSILNPTVVAYGKLAMSVFFTTIQFLPVILALMFLTKQIFDHQGLGKLELNGHISTSSARRHLTYSEQLKYSRLKTDLGTVNQHRRNLRLFHFILITPFVVAACFFMSFSGFPAVYSAIAGVNNTFNTSYYLQYAKLFGMTYIITNNSLMFLDTYLSEKRNRIYKKFEHLFENKHITLIEPDAAPSEDLTNPLKQEHIKLEGNAINDQVQAVDTISLGKSVATPSNNASLDRSEKSSITPPNSNVSIASSEKFAITSPNTFASVSTCPESIASPHRSSMQQPESVSDRLYTSPAKTHHSEQNLLSSVDNQSHKGGVSGAGTPVQEDSWTVVGSVHLDRDRSKKNSNPIVALWHNGPVALWHNLRSLGKSPIRSSTKNTTNYNPESSPETSTSIRQGFDEDTIKEAGAGDIAPRRLYLEEDLGEKPKI